MENIGNIETDKFNGQSFELWKLMMDDLLVGRYHWTVVDLGTTPIEMLTKN